MATGKTGREERIWEYGQASQRRLSPFSPRPSGPTRRVVRASERLNRIARYALRRSLARPKLRLVGSRPYRCEICGLTTSAIYEIRRAAAN